MNGRCWVVYSWIKSVRPFISLILWIFQHLRCTCNFKLRLRQRAIKAKIRETRNGQSTHLFSYSHRAIIVARYLSVCKYTRIQKNKWHCTANGFKMERRAQFNVVWKNEKALQMHTYIRFRFLGAGAKRSEKFALFSIAICAPLKRILQQHPIQLFENLISLADIISVCRRIYFLFPFFICAFSNELDWNECWLCL